jgi:hypothetical protein
MHRWVIPFGFDICSAAAANSGPRPDDRPTTEFTFAEKLPLWSGLIILIMKAVTENSFAIRARLIFYIYASVSCKIAISLILQGLFVAYDDELSPSREAGDGAHLRDFRKMKEDGSLLKTFRDATESYMR